MISIFTGIFGKIFSDWRLIAMAILIGVCGYMTVRLKVEQVHLQKAQEVIKVVETNNVVLKQNVAVITKVNQENVKMLEQLKADSALTAKTVVQLNNTLTARDRTVSDMKKRLNSLGTPVTKPTPYIDLAVKGMQQLRNESALEGGTK